VERAVIEGGCGSALRRANGTESSEWSCGLASQGGEGITMTVTSQRYLSITREPSYQYDYFTAIWRPTAWCLGRLLVEAGAPAKGHRTS